MLKVCVVWITELQKPSNEVIWQLQIWKTKEREHRTLNSNKEPFQHKRVLQNSVILNKTITACKEPYLLECKGPGPWNVIWGGSDLLDVIYIIPSTPPPHFSERLFIKGLSLVFYVISGTCVFSVCILHHPTPYNYQWGTPHTFIHTYTLTYTLINSNQNSPTTNNQCILSCLHTLQWLMGNCPVRLYIVRPVHQGFMTQNNI